MIQNGYNVATMANGTADADWQTCMSCAILSRSFFKTGTSVPEKCVSCFDKHCWNGTTNATTPNIYEPVLQLGAAKVSGAARREYGAEILAFTAFAATVFAIV